MRHALVALSFALLLTAFPTSCLARANGGGLLGRLFRGSSSRNEKPDQDRERGEDRETAPRYRTDSRKSQVPESDLAPIAPLSPTPGAAPGAQPAGGRLVPQSRQSRPITQAEPIVSRVSIGRADDGKQFCMFMQIHADGVVLDTEGVHRIGPDLMKPLLSILQDPELLRPRSHCGSPPTDFYEQFQVTIYRRAIGRIQANAFTYSGNTQGCDHSARRLHDALDAIQNKLSSPATVTATGSPPARLALEESGITPRRAVPTDNHQGHLPPPLPLAPIPDLEPPSR